MAATAAASGGWTPERSVAGGRNPWTIVGVISIATFMVVLDTSIANVALGHIAGSLSASYDEATWVITSFLVANAVIVPISGWLADVIGRKRYYMISVALFSIASLLCGLSPNLTFLVIARVLQGLGGGGLAPIEQSMLVDTFPPEKRGMAFAAYGLVVIAAPIFGPVLGGYITDDLTWNWVFLINVPVGMISLVLVYLFVAESKALRTRTAELTHGGFKFDFVGFGLIALFLGCLEVMADRGQENDWFSSPMIATLAAVSAISLALFVPWELTREDPIVKIRMFGRRNFLAANILLLLLGTIVFGSTQFIPQLLQEVLGYSATDAGLALTVGGIATLVVMPISGVLANKVDARILIGFAFVTQGLALYYMSHLNTNMTFGDAAAARMYQAIGLPFLFVSITGVAYVGLQPTESNQASALMNMSRNLGGTFGISLVQTLLLRREQFHQARMVETLNPLNPNYQHWIHTATSGLVAHGQPPLQASRSAIGILYAAMMKQAAMLSYLDAFHVLAIIIFCVIPLVFLMKAPAAAAPPAAAP